MKTLFLLRHAKASSGSSTLPDFERPLNEQGRTQARLVGRYLKRQQIAPDLVLGSPAVRVRQTTDIVAATAGLTSEISFDVRIYEASCRRLFEVLSEIDEKNRHVLLVGHNPGLEELLRQLTGRFESLSTATLAMVSLSGSTWTSVADHAGHLDWLVNPI